MNYTSLFFDDTNSIGIDMVKASSNSLLRRWAFVLTLVWASQVQAMWSGKVLGTIFGGASGLASSIAGSAFLDYFDCDNGAVSSFVRHYDGPILMIGASAGTTLGACIGFCLGDKFDQWIMSFANNNVSGGNKGE